MPLGYIFSMEGADPILSPRDPVRWWEDGLRVVSLAHYGVSDYAHGIRTARGLTPRGIDLLKAMGEVGMILDVTHLADKAMGQVLEHFTLPMLASHSNCRALVPGAAATLGRANPTPDRERFRDWRCLRLLDAVSRISAG